MTLKRKRERENESEARMKRPRRRKRSSSEPGLLHDPVNNNKRKVLKRLFGRNYNLTSEREASGSSGNFPGPSVSTSHQINEDEPFDREESPVRDTPNVEGEQNNEEPYQEDSVYHDENADPLLDSVPVNLDPEQLGFLVCAQETLRFLNIRGFTFEHPVFTRLRSRLIRGMCELAVA